MSQPTDREQAIADSKAIWRQLAITGSADKRDTIFRLYLKELVSCSHYSFGCPLCTLYNTDDADPAMCCINCPWPGERLPVDDLNAIPCCRPESPYDIWRKQIGKYKTQLRKHGSASRHGLQKAASAVYQLIKTFK